MARKPQPGGDRNAWGIVLNEFLDTAHNLDGTIKPAGVQTAVATEVETALAIQVPPAVADAVAADSTVAAAAAAAIDAEPRISQLVTDVATVESVADNANLYATIADNLYYNVMSPAKGPVAAGDGVTDDWAAIQHRLDNLPTSPDSARGGKVVLEPGRTYAISQTLNITLVNTDLDGLVGGTLTNMGATTIKALPGFTGPLIRINIPSGSKGAWIRNLKLDGSGLASAGIEYATGTISVAHLFDVAIINCDIGIKTGVDCQSIIWDRVLAFSGIRVGVDIGAKMRHLVVNDSRIGGTEWAAVIGADTAVSADRTETVIFDTCELYTVGTNAQGVVLVRNADNPRITNSYVEVAATQATVLPANIVLGTATAFVRTPVITGNRFGGNNKSNYGVKIVNVQYPYIAFNGNDVGVLLGMVDNSNAYAGMLSRGFVMGPTISGQDRFSSTISNEMPAGYDAFAAYVNGDAHPRVHVRTNEVSVRFGSGATAADTILLRGTPNQLMMGAGDSFKVDGTWNGGRLQLGTYNLWVDATGDLRIKNGAPASDLDGTIVGSQS